ncbi:hypothetical protein Taro_001604 [Colocasia esculenta]|uniref:Uncharacterized protein n=1 Tax=Colocasia esculenta TaxID=4460 RepID=A0A843TE39_COLES|nr:hypothetical protein [Colocasia esculenta]
MCSGTIIYYKGSVDTPNDGVDIMFQALSQNMKNWSTSVDTRPGQVNTRCRQVDTRWLSRKASFAVWDSRSTPDADRSTLAVWDSRSTLDDLRSTLETSPRELFCQSGTVCRHTSWAGRHTLEFL